MSAAALSGSELYARLTQHGATPDEAARLVTRRDQAGAAARIRQILREER